MSYINFANTSAVDNAGRHRMSQAQNIVECKFIQNKEPYLNEELLVGGATISYSFFQAAVSLNVGTASGDRAVRESHRYLPYFPGNSMTAAMTVLMGPQKAGVLSRVGLFNDNNGLFLERNSTDVRFVIRTNTSGSASDANFITQANWNRDRLDGSGSSGVILDLNDLQNFVIDYRWNGRVRLGFNIGGIIIYCHEFSVNNINTVVYMRRASLPIRYEILNTGTSASSSTMKQISYSGKSEGPTLLDGSTYSVAHGIATIAVTTRRPILALRLMNTLDGNINRRQMRIETISLYTKAADTFFEYGHVHSDWTSVAGGTWVQIDPSSGVEYNLGITGITGGTTHITDNFYVSSGQGSFAGAIQGSPDITGSHTWLNQNISSTKSEIGVIYATSMSGTANVAAGITFNEID